MIVHCFDFRKKRNRNRSYKLAEGGIFIEYFHFCIPWFNFDRGIGSDWIKKIHKWCV